MTPELEEKYGKAMLALARKEGHKPFEIQNYSEVRKAQSALGGHKRQGRPTGVTIAEVARIMSKDTWTKGEDIAKAVGLSVNTLRGKLRELEDAGAIERRYFNDKPVVPNEWRKK